MIPITTDLIRITAVTMETTMVPMTILWTITEQIVG